MHQNHNRQSELQPDAPLVWLREQLTTRYLVQEHLYWYWTSNSRLDELLFS